MAFKANSTTPPTLVNSSVGRTRQYLTGADVEKLMAAARRSSRYGHRDATMILLAYRHGLRASEVCDLQWHQVECGLCLSRNARLRSSSCCVGRTPVLHSIATSTSKDRSSFTTPASSAAKALYPRGSARRTAAADRRTGSRSKTRPHRAQGLRERGFWRAAFRRADFLFRRGLALSIQQAVLRFSGPLF